MFIKDFTKLFEADPVTPVTLAAAGGGAETDSYTSLKELVKNDLGVLKQVTFLNKQYHGDDPRLTSKESKVAMSAVLSKLFYTDDRSAFYLGSMEWTPNLSVWMRFLDMIGDQPLGKFFGINSAEDLPSFEGSDMGGELGSIFPHGVTPSSAPENATASTTGTPAAVPETPANSTQAAVPPTNEINPEDLA